MKPRLKSPFYLALGLVAAGVVLFWASTFDLDLSSPYVMPGLFVSGNLVVIVLGLTIQPTKWLRDSCLLFLGLDGLCLLAAIAALLSSLPDPGLEALVGRLLFPIIAIPVALMFCAQLWLYRRRLSRARI